MDFDDIDEMRKKYEELNNKKSMFKLERYEYVAGPTKTFRGWYGLLQNRGAHEKPCLCVWGYSPVP